MPSLRLLTLVAASLFCWGYAVESRLCNDILILVIVLADELITILICQFLGVTLGHFLHLVLLGAYMQSPFLQLDSLTE
jgi:hypothetical protein